MKCQSCGKKQATVKYYENINGIKKEFHLCTDCGNKIGFTHFSENFSPMFVSIPDFLDNEILKCENCGYTLDDYTKTGLFGCAECYNTFNDSLDELFLKIHGKNRHVKLNNVNKKINKNNEIEELKKQLQKSIKEERYEDAALIRDKIKELENK